MKRVKVGMKVSMTEIRNLGEIIYLIVALGAHLRYGGIEREARFRAEISFAWCDVHCQ